MAQPVIDNYDDPCALAKSLKAAYLRIIQGQQESEVEYTGNNVTRRVRFTQTDLAELKRAIQEADAMCNLETPGTTDTRRRFAIQGRRRPEYL